MFNRSIKFFWVILAVFFLLWIYSNKKTVSKEPVLTENEIVAKEGASIASIFGTVPDSLNPGHSREVNAGSGFFVKNGYLLTNKHVVAGAQDDFTVILSTGEKRKGVVIYRDQEKDLAYLKVDGKDLTVIDSEDSADLKIGQNVYGIGNANGKSVLSISSGKILGFGKNIVSSEGQSAGDLIQTSVKLYPGDSGGPLLDSDGRVIGINVAVGSSSDNSSFAIPFSEAKKIIDSIP
jgi:serine protease Do